jgi:vacuolar protein sorting-associated protein 13A/C
LDYDEKETIANSLEAPRNSLKTRVSAKLQTGSFALKTDPHGDQRDILSMVFDSFHANVVQRPDNLEAILSLDAFKVFDGTTKDTLYSQIVRVKSSMCSQERQGSDEPVFFVKYEKNPLDNRADNALTLRMRPMEIIYHKGYVEAVYKFFKPPPSQLESVEALLVRYNYSPRRLPKPASECSYSDSRRAAERKQGWSGICSANAQDD